MKIRLRRPPEPPVSAWPEGVIARYLTVAQATVDIRHDSGVRITRALCTGCGSSEAEDYADGPGWADHAVRKWAQKHAESCRALPRPGGAA